VLFGDEFASARAADYAGAQIFDMGFKGDKTQNMLWRLAHKPICGYDPQLIVVSAGRHNAGENTPEEIEAAKRRILARIRAQAPEAEVLVLND
jgi:beta-glucosidase